MAISRDQAPADAEALRRKVNLNTAPRGVFGETHNRPSWASMIARQIDNPIPIPSDLVVKSGLNIRSISCGLTPVPVSETETITLSPSYASDFTHRTLGSSLAAIAWMAFVIKLRSTC